MTVQEAMFRASNRLHHLSMRYSGALQELISKEKVGLIPHGAPGLREARDLIDLILFTRAEINGLSNLLVQKLKLLTPDELTKEMTEQYEFMTDAKARFLDVEVSDAGLVFKRPPVN
jgi:hypothetical protein